MFEKAGKTMDRFKRLRFESKKGLYELADEYIQEMGWAKKHGDKWFERHIIDNEYKVKGLKTLQDSFGTKGRPEGVEAPKYGGRERSDN